MVTEVNYGPVRPSARRKGCRTTPFWSATRILTCQFFVLIYLQKFALTFSENAQISISMIGVFALLIPGMIAGVYAIDKVLLRLFAVFASAVAVQALVPAFSATSLALLLVLYGSFTLSWSCTPSEYSTVCANFSRMMILPALLIFVQIAFELWQGVGNSLSIEPLIPDALLLKGYTYEASREYWVVWNRPNGLVFLEPSFCSAFLALALIFELQVLRRHARAALFGAAMAATNGATGALMLAIAVVMLGVMRKPVITFLVIVTGVAILATLGSMAEQLPLLSRLSELETSNTSGYERLVLPLQTVVNLLFDPAYVFYGNGAGQITDAYGNPWPVSKLAFEYGALVTLLYFVFVCVRLWGRLNRPVRAAMFVVFQFTGGYLLNPFMVNLVMLTCSGRVTCGGKDPAQADR